MLTKNEIVSPLTKFWLSPRCVVISRVIGTLRVMGDLWGPMAKALTGKSKLTTRPKNSMPKRQPWQQSLVKKKTGRLFFICNNQNPAIYKIIDRFYHNLLQAENSTEADSYTVDVMYFSNIIIIAIFLSLRLKRAVEI